MASKCNMVGEILQHSKDSKEKLRKYELSGPVAELLLSMCQALGLHPSTIPPPTTQNLKAKLKAQKDAVNC